MYRVATVTEICYILFFQVNGVKIRKNINFFHHTGYKKQKIRVNVKL